MLKQTKDTFSCRQNNPFVVATLLVHNKPWAALRVIRAIRAQTRQVDALIIVDNGSAHPLLNILNEAGISLGEHEQLITIDVNIGVGGGHNRAFQVARDMGADLIWILEGDTFVDPDCLASLIELQGGTCDVVAIPRLARNEYERIGLDLVPPVYDGSLQSTERQHIMTFNGILLPTSLIEKVGQIREDFFVGLEDRDFCWRLATSDGRLIVSRYNLGIHPTRGNNRFPEPVSAQRLYYSTRNELILKREIGISLAGWLIGRTIGAAVVALLTGHGRIASARISGLFHGLSMPIRKKITDLNISIAVSSGSEYTPVPIHTWLCRVCGTANNDNIFNVRSWRKFPNEVKFRYGECSSCQSLTLLDTVDPSSYYSSTYERLRSRNHAINPLYITRRMIGTFCRFNGRLFGCTSIFDRFTPTWYRWFRGFHVECTSPILDVGCGNGALLYHLRSFGFDNLIGIDPYLPNEHNERGVSLERSSLDNVSGHFKIILFNHSIEYVDDPGTLLDRAYKLLQPGGILIIRVPIVGGAAWHRYRDNLWSLDAPLHRFIPTPEGIARLAKAHHFAVTRWSGETPLFIYEKSELIRVGCPCDGSQTLDDQLRKWAKKIAKREVSHEAALATFILVPQQLET